MTPHQTTTASTTMQRSSPTSSSTNKGIVVNKDKKPLSKALSDFMEEETCTMPTPVPLSSLHLSDDSTASSVASAINRARDPTPPNATPPVTPPTQPSTLSQAQPPVRPVTPVVDRKGKRKAVEVEANPEDQGPNPANERWRSYSPNITPEDWDRRNEELLAEYYKEAVPNTLLTAYQQVYEDIAGPAKIMQQRKLTEECDPNDFPSILFPLRGGAFADHTLLASSLLELEERDFK